MWFWGLLGLWVQAVQCASGVWPICRSPQGEPVLQGIRHAMTRRLLLETLGAYRDHGTRPRGVSEPDVFMVRAVSLRLPPERSPGSMSVRPSCARSSVPILDMSCDVAEARAGAMTESTMQVRFKRISYEAENINSYELVTATGGDLAPFAAGSHIDLHLPNGMIRSYSLVNDQRELSRYVIAVNKDTVGRGGSRFIPRHDTGRGHHPDLAPPEQLCASGRCQPFHPDRRRDRNYAAAVDGPPARGTRPQMEAVLRGKDALRRRVSRRAQRPPARHSFKSADRS